MFTEDSRTENFLRSLGIKFEYREGLRLPEDFAPDWNMVNIGRPVPVRDEAVTDYAAKMRGGSAAPAPILCVTKAGYEVCDGVQRLSAKRQLQDTIVSAYVVKTTDATSLALIRVLANLSMQGHAENPEWSKKRAIEVLVFTEKMSYAEVARRGSWAESDVRRIAEAIKLQLRITNAGGPVLPATLLEELQPYLATTRVLDIAAAPVTGFLQLLQKSKMSAEDAVTYIELFFEPPPRPSTAFKEYSDRLSAMHDDPEIKARVTGRQRTKISRDIVLLKHLKAADTIADQILTHGEGVTNADEYYRILKNVREKIETIVAGKKRSKKTGNSSDRKRVR